MATAVAPGMYQVSPVEGISFVINATGSGFGVSAALETQQLTFAAGTPLRIPPQMMSGLGSSHDLRIRLIFTAGSTPMAVYTVNAFDDGGAQIDALSVHIDTARPLPYQTLIQLGIDVV